MKRNLFILISLILTLVPLTGCVGLFLSEEERYQRAEDYALLRETLRTIGHDGNINFLRERNSMEQNLRALQRYRESYDYDSRKLVELLILLKSFDFIAEGLQNKAPNNPYFNDWPRGAGYDISSNAVRFRTEEIYWLMLLLSESDIPDEHYGLLDVLLENGENAFSRLSTDGATRSSIWFYYQINSPGLLERVNPSWDSFISDEMKTVFIEANDDIHQRFLQVIDGDGFRDTPHFASPARVFAPIEAKELMHEFPPMGLWDGGYIRIVSNPEQKHDINMSSFGAYLYAWESDVLVPVINPADARFAIYEEYTDGIFYAFFTGDRDFDLYLAILNIHIVDLLTGEEIFNESVISNYPPDEITWTTTFYGLIGDLKIVDGRYYYHDFDWAVFAAVMERHISE